MKKVLLLGIAFFISALVLTSCKDNARDKQSRKKHLVERNYPKLRTLYIDTLAASAVMNEKKDVAATTKFYCYKVGISDSIKRDKKEMQEWGKYFDYDMQYDWKMIAGSDTIPVVFFQPAIKKTTNLYEGVLVFEVPENVKPTSLYYRENGLSDRIELIDLNSK